ncbi:nucleotidyltransferase [bacterium]|nr:nucleotidyltransferase [bacterium]
MKNLNDLLFHLIKSEIEFVVVGGFAGVLHGSTLVTRDLDLCTILTSENIEKLRKSLAEFNPRHRMTVNKLSFLEAPPKGQQVNNLYLETSLGVVDFISSITGVGDFERVSTKADTVKLNGQSIKVINISDLISAKEAMGRAKDLLSASELKAIQAKVEKKT